MREILIKIVRLFLALLRIRFSRPMDKGITFFGVNMSLVGSYPVANKKGRGVAGIDELIRRSPVSMVDLGAGSNVHALKVLSKLDCEVVTVDYGTSVYSRNSVQLPPSIKSYFCDIYEFESPHLFEAVWASHVLEHQLNSERFIRKCLSLCAPDGFIYITLPTWHRAMLGGHLSIWSPGLLAYNVVLCGIDLSDANLLYGDDEFTLIFSPRSISLPSDLTYDSGDLSKLANYLPSWVYEGADMWPKMNFQSGSGF
ncbi:methyltransferase domain-containing protein [Limnobacter sp.]|uniref:class I SAM-dependent methyltransferase n=1 Tax=Limnobacter sp. TaxID=2003368 RepID=UPI00311EC897